MKMMTFQLGGETYAVDLAYVAFVGRGEVAAEDAQRPRVELAALLGAQDRPGAGAPVLVLRGGDGREVGVPVDRLGEVVEVDGAAMSEVPRYFQSPLLKGVARVGEGLAIVLDAAMLLAGAGTAEAGAGETGGRA